MNVKHGFWMFVTSCLSGCGQMYQGYMKRGISLLVLFFALLAVAGFFGIAPIAFFLPVVWAYAFFDSYNLRARIAAGEPPEDAYLFGMSDMDSQQLHALLRKRHSIIGWVLVFLGVYMLYDTLLDRIGWIWGWDWLYNLLRYDVPRLALTVLVILLGLWFIRGPRNKREEDIPEFVPPTRPGAAAARPADPEPPPAEEPAQPEDGPETAPEASAPEETEVPHDRDHV